MFSENLTAMRKIHSITQEDLAEAVGVSRQAIAKWENGDTVPDIEKCQKLAQIFGVSLDDLVNHQTENIGLPVPPKGKHLFGIVTVGEKGQIVIPKKARDLFSIQSGDQLMILGDENTGIAIMKADEFMMFAEEVRKNFGK